MRTIKLMADYECFPLWEASPGDVGNIDPRDLPISSDLQKRLLLWASTFDETLNWADPASSGFDDETEETIFRKEGAALASSLRSELGSGFDVIIKL